jgi:ribosomal protein S18 acetylase RimI-like enzyme
MIFFQALWFPNQYNNYLVYAIWQREETMKEFKARLIRKNEIDHIATMLSEIFLDNAAYEKIFDQKDKMKGLKWMFERALKLNIKYGNVYVIDDLKTNSLPIGTFSLSPPNSKSPSLFDYVILGMPLMPFKFGIDSFKRMMFLMNENKNKITEQIPGAEYWYLGMVAIDPKFRRKGISSTLLTEIFSGIPKPKNIALTTQLIENVSFYEKIGFKVLAENYMGYNVKNIPNWVMYYTES